MFTALSTSGKTAETWILGRKKPNNFDFLRFFFAVFVVFGHSFWVLEDPFIPSRDPIRTLTHGRLYSGYISVNAFFVISGFLVLHSYLSGKSVWLYLKKRVMRIYPGFIFNVLVSLLLFIPLAQPAGFHYLSTLDYNNLLASAARFYFGPSHLFPGNAESGDYTFNASLWSIPFEFKCYILVIMLGLVRAFRWRVSILLLYLLTLVLYAHHPDTWPSWPRLLCAYSAGMTFYLYRDRIPKNRWLMIVCAALMIVTWITGIGVFFSLNTCGVYLLMYIAFSPVPGISNFARHGDYSYGVYLYSLPIQQLFAYYFKTHLGPLTLFAAAMPPTLFFAWLSWNLVEKPFLTFKENTSAARHGIDPHATSPDVVAAADAPLVSVALEDVKS